MKSWMTIREIAEAKLPALPATQQGVQKVAASEGWEHRRDRNGRPLWRERTGRGGGREWHVSVLPVMAQAALVGKALKLGESASSALSCHGSSASKPTALRGEDKAVAIVDEGESSAWFERLPARVRNEATWRLGIIDNVEALIPITGKANGVARAALEAGISPSTIWNWLELIHGVSRAARLPALAPKPKGKPPRVTIDSDLLAFFTDDWLRPAQPTFESCYRRTLVWAGKRQLILPPAKTLIRRVRENVPKYQEVLRREGVEALGRMFPHQERDRSHFNAMQCVCADGHKWDVFVEFPDGDIDRPVSVGFQDLYSNKILSLRHARTESAHVTNMAIHDMVRDWGIPERCWLDNGRAFASKWVSGGQANRFRFKVKDSDPNGSLTLMGVIVHWTKPYSGQSKPIERTWRDFCANISKHPAFAGAYTGNKPDAKPSDYATRAVPYALFAKIVADGVAEHNARTGRRTRVCGGTLSFNQAFEASYQNQMIARPDPWHLRAMLLQADHFTVSGADCSIKIGGNRYWHEALSEWKGRRMIVRFDPTYLAADLLVYTPDGGLLCEAPCLEAIGFDSMDDAKTHAKAKAAFIRGKKLLAEAEQKYSPALISQYSATNDWEWEDNLDSGRVIEATPPKARRIVGGGAAAQADAFDPMLDYFTRQTEARGSHLRIVNSDDEDS